MSDNLGSKGNDANSDPNYVRLYELNYKLWLVVVMALILIRYYNEIDRLLWLGGSINGN